MDANTPNEGLETVKKGNEAVGQQAVANYTADPKKLAEQSFIKYEGEFKNGQKHGWGTAVYPDGSNYVGQWVNNNPSGKGKLTNKITDPKIPAEYYEGEWLGGKMNGKGTQYWKDGSSYTGEYLLGQKNGFGTFSWPDGNKYTGHYKADLREGQGTFTW